MKIDLKKLENKAKKDLKSAKNLKELDEAFKMSLGRSGELTEVLRSLSKLSKAQRVKTGKEANILRNVLKDEFEKRAFELEQEEVRSKQEGEWIDTSAPGKKVQKGHLHPLTLTHRKIREVFSAMGFAVVEGPEMESEWYNFDALNIPADHPARDLWDTFWLKANKGQKVSKKEEKTLLRTHTSPVQVRHMEGNNPPLMIIAPGRVFRYEATDAHHNFDFFQLEGLVIGKDISVAHFRAILLEFYCRFFGKEVNIRLRPSFFSFTEPSFEVDMSCIICNQKGCSSCGHTGWLEMMGAGMVHPNVLKAAGYMPGKWQGFAFGMGLDRLVMMKYKVDDVRLLLSGDIRFLEQF